MVVTKATIKSAIYKLFYNTIVDNYGNPHTTRFLVYHSFPLDKLTDRAAYPLIVVNGPYFSDDVEFTFRETTYDCELTVMIYHTSKKDLCTMVEGIVNLIENRTKSVFEANGVEFLKITSDGSEPFDHGSQSGNNAVLGHVETITFEMKVYLNRINT